MSVKRYFMFVVLFIIIFSFVSAITMDLNISSSNHVIPTWTNMSGSLDSALISADKLNSQKAYCIAGADDMVYKTASKTLDTIRKPYIRVQSISDIDTTLQYECLIVIDRQLADADIDSIRELLANGIPVIFAQIPNESTLSNSATLSLLGIEQIGKERVPQEGFHIIDGFLMGGHMTFEKAETYAHEVTLTSKCKTYIRADNKDLSITNEEQTALLWRTYHQGTPLFVFNNTFLYSDEGIGPLVSVLSFLEDVFVYPIVSSFSVTLTDFPLGNDYDTQAKLIFDRGTQSALRDIIFPDFVLLSSKAGVELTFYCKSRGVEEGFWKKEMRKHRYMLYESEGNTAPGLVTQTGFRSKNYNEFLNRGLVTAMGFIHHTVSMEDAFIPSPEYDWRLLAKDFTSELNAMSVYFPWLNQLSHDKAVQALNAYYSIKPKITISNDRLNIECENFRGSAVFIVRLKGEAELAQNSMADVEKIERGIYKVTMHTQNASFEVKHIRTP